ncbi:MAG TPA: hypothetical protein VFM18_06770 [Methanosarcina sp.]|nr:hypothetical protein [Methanosarcina sp.]
MKKKINVKNVMDKETKARFDAITRMGCCVCREYHGVISPAVVHHLTGLENGRAMGRKSPDENTIALCPTHHTDFLGIHYLGKREWERRFGLQSDYLLKTNQLLKEMN